MTTTEKTHFILNSQQGVHTRASVARIIDVTRERVRQIVSKDSLEYLLKPAVTICPECGGRKDGQSKSCRVCQIARTPRIIFSCHTCRELKEEIVSSYKRSKLHFCSRKCLEVYAGKTFGWGSI